MPPDYAAEMVPFDPLVGEFRVHYAGFFDPGFGHSEAGGAGSRAVLEVRSHEIPFILEARPDRSAGSSTSGCWSGRASSTARDIGSHYQAQGLKLSKHFRTRLGGPAAAGAAAYAQPAGEIALGRSRGRTWRSRR